MQDAAPVAPGRLAGRREWIGLAVLALPAFVIALDFSAVLASARAAFTSGVDVVACVSAVIAAALAVIAVARLRRVSPADESAAAGDAGAGAGAETAATDPGRGLGARSPGSQPQKGMQH